MKRKKNTHPAQPDEEIIIHGLWQTPRIFKAQGKVIRDAIPTLPSLLAMSPGCIVPGKPLKEFAAIHKDDILTFTFPEGSENHIPNEATIEATREGYNAVMRLRPTIAELDHIGFTSLIYANLGNQ